MTVMTTTPAGWTVAMQVGSTSNSRAKPGGAMLPTKAEMHRYPHPYRHHDAPAVLTLRPSSATHTERITNCDCAPHVYKVQALVSGISFSLLVRRLLHRHQRLHHLHLRCHHLVLVISGPRPCRLHLHDCEDGRTTNTSTSTSTRPPSYTGSAAGGHECTASVQLGRVQGACCYYPNMPHGSLCLFTVRDKQQTANSSHFHCTLERPANSKQQPLYCALAVE